MFTVVITKSFDETPSVYIVPTLKDAQTIGMPMFGETGYIYDHKGSHLETITRG